LNARLTTLLCKKIIVAKSKEVKTGCNLAETSKEGSESAVLSMMMNTGKVLGYYLNMNQCSSCSHPSLITVYSHLTIQNFTVCAVEKLPSNNP
jgi:hypothetical protein